jgi:hypothetical protein
VKLSCLIELELKITYEKIVIPAKAGIQPKVIPHSGTKPRCCPAMRGLFNHLDSRFRGNDETLSESCLAK